MTLEQVILHERAATTLFQCLGDLSFIGTLSKTSRPLLEAMKSMVRSGRQHALHKQITITCYPSETVNMDLASSASWSVSLHQILNWLVDCRVVLRAATGSYEDPENLYTYLPPHVYPSCSELVVQTRYIYRFDGISETFPNVQHLKLDLQRERDATVNVLDIAQLEKNFRPLLSLSISAPEAENIVGTAALRSLTSLRSLSFYGMEGIEIRDLEVLLREMKLLEEVKIYTELLDGYSRIVLPLDLSGHEQLRVLAFQNVRLVTAAERPTGGKLQIVPPPNLQTLICVTSEGSTRGRKGPSDLLGQQLLEQGVDVRHYDTWQEAEASLSR